MSIDELEIGPPITFSKELPELPASTEGWPEQGEWTYEAYLRLPDDGRRYEIIEGVLYVANAPSYSHQFTVIAIATFLNTAAQERRLGVVLTAPFEVHLPGVAKPVLPDILFIAAERQPSPDAQYFEGAPDLVIEVSSPSTARTDRFVKFYAYERAGVPEFWLVNPHTRAIEVYARSDRGVFELRDQYLSGDTLTSTALPELSIPVSELFAPDTSNTPPAQPSRSTR